MKQLLNKLAVWLYQQTRDDSQDYSLGTVMSGIMVIESPYVPNGKCIMGTGDVNKIKRFNVFDELNRI